MVVAALLALLGGCGMLRLAYGQADVLAYRWLDGYVDFDDAQALRVRAGLDSWFAWNRRTQLGGYVELLGRIDAAVPADTTPQAVCGWWRDIRQRIDAGVEQAVPALADVALSLRPAQIGNVERRYAKLNREYREQYLQPDAAKRIAEAVKRAVDRAESLYGSVEPAQRERIATWVRDSPFDAQIALDERLQRQQDSLQLLRRLGASPGATDLAQAGIRAFLQEFDRSPREAYRRHQAQVVQHNCRLAADVHNSTSPAQRQAASARLRSWSADLRALAGEAPG